jgi:adenylate cyclase class IV
MALGYEIGTIMRRRSTIYRTADEEVQVKLDEIANLGEFVQVGGTRSFADGARLGAAAGPAV